MPYVCSSVHPPRDERPFSAVVCIKVSLCNNIALGTISIHCQILLQKSPVISLLTIFLVVVPLQHFSFFLFFSCPGSQGSVFFFFQSFHISKALLYTNDSSRRAQNNIQSLCHVNTPFVSLHQIQPDVKRQHLHLASVGANAAMEIFRVGASLSPSLFLSLAGVNGASFCLVQHQCYFDVMAIPLPDQ